MNPSEIATEQDRQATEHESFVAECQRKLGQWREVLGSRAWTILKDEISRVKAIHMTALLKSIKETQGLWETVGYINALNEIEATPGREIVKLTSLIDGGRNGRGKTQHRGSDTHKHTS